ncbi:hypothetical protein JCM10213_002056 [Rhodosporidiobolus nylandii]
MAVAKRYSPAQKRSCQRWFAQQRAFKARSARDAAEDTETDSSDEDNEEDGDEDGDSDMDSSDSESSGCEDSDEEEESGSEEESDEAWEPCPLAFKPRRLPPLPAFSSSWWKKTKRGSPIYTGSAGHLRTSAWKGDALLKKEVAESLKRRYQLSLAPRHIACQLLRNNVISHVAVAYRVHTRSEPVSSQTQHHAADAFEAMATVIKAEQLTSWVEKVFCHRVFPDLKEEVAEFRGRLGSDTRYRNRMSEKQKRAGGGSGKAKRGKRS